MALVFMLKGLQIPHKQIVARCLTSNRVKLKKLIVGCNQISNKKLIKNGIFVLVVNYDTGSAYVGVWREAKIPVKETC